MQSGLDSSAALIDFISSAQKDDLRQLLRYAGEVLPDGEDGVVHLRAALMERDGVWGTLVTAAELGARARAGGPRAGGGQDGTQEPPG